MSRKDISVLLDAARAQGFTVRLRRSGHYRVTAPSGATATVPATPSGGRSVANTRAALRRIGAVL